MNTNADNHFLIDTAKKAMETQVEDDGDFAPTLVLDYQTGGTTVVVLAIEGHPFDILVTNAKDIIQGPLAAISLTCDTYMWKGDGETFAPGPLAPRFQAGDPDVSEAIQISAAHLVSGEAVSLSVTLPYERNRLLHTITWNEGFDDAVEHSGRMVDLMKALLVASQVLS